MKAKLRTMSDAIEKLRNYVMTECIKHDFCTDDCPFYHMCDMSSINWDTFANFAEAYDKDKGGTKV